MADSNPQMTAGEKIEKTCWQCGRSFVTAMEVCPDDGARLIETGLEDKEDPLVGTIFDGRFEIQGKLGEGGMGSVYSARRLDFETDVALKLLKADFARDDGIRKRFMYEARVISNLRHPHAIRLYDFGQATDGHVYMVMELLEGESLADRLSYRFVSYQEVFDIIPPICGVLGEAHIRDVIHRDLKPENIYLLEVDGNKEFPKLLDFGIAKHNRAETMTKSGTLWGTPAYMSPEQASGHAVGAPADIYGIGIMIYELISGNLPFHASTQMGYAVKHINEEVRPLSSIPGLRSVPEELDELIVSMLAKDPDDRPESMEVVASTLARIRDECFDDELLKSVPAQEVDPIGLQRWMKEAPDISQDLPAEKVGELHVSEELLAETAVFDTGDAQESEEDQRRARMQTAVVDTPGDVEGDEEFDEGRAFADTEAFSGDADIASREVRRTEVSGADVDEADEESTSRWQAMPVRVALGLVVIGSLIGAAALIFGDFDETSMESDGEAVVETPVDTPQENEVEPNPNAAEDVAAAATGQAIGVVIEAYGIVQQIDPDSVGEDFERDFDFLHQPAGEDSGQEGSSISESSSEEDDDARLREALEQTF